MIASVSFILFGTNVDTFTNWLVATWRPPSVARIQVQMLGKTLLSAGGGRRLAADGMLVLEPKGQDHAEAHLLPEVFFFDILPIGQDRTEVHAECHYSYNLLPWFADLFAEMVKRWPEMRDTLETKPGASFPENDTQQQSLDLFTKHMRRLKIKPGQRAAMYNRPAADYRGPIGQVLDISHELVRRQAQAIRNAALAYEAMQADMLGDSDDEAQPLAPLEVRDRAHHASATFYLDTNPASFKAWLAGKWRRKHAANIWEPGRIMGLEPMAEQTDSDGRRLLTVAASYIGAGKQVLGSNDRVLEFLLTPLSEDRIEVIAACSELAWVARLARLLIDIKTAYRDKMYLTSYSCGWALLDDPSEEERELFRNGADEFRETMARIDPRFEPYAPSEDSPEAQPPADDSPRADEVAPSEPAHDDGPAPDPDDIPRWGTRRDLSTNEVRGIVRRGKQYQAVGGSIATFHEQESRQWSDPEDWPKSYSLKTLQKWMTQQRFQ